MKPNRSRSQRYECDSDQLNPLECVFMFSILSVIVGLYGPQWRLGLSELWRT
jgi:hypothetical protein